MLVARPLAEDQERPVGQDVRRAEVFHPRLRRLAEQLPRRGVGRVPDHEVEPRLRPVLHVGEDRLRARVLVGDDSYLIQEGLRNLLARVQGLDVLGVHGDYDSLLHHDTLTDVERSHGLRHLPSKLNIAPFLARRRAARQLALLDQQTCQAERGFANRDAFTFQFRSDGSQQHIVLGDGDAAKECEGAKIRTDTRKQVGLLDTAHHHRLPDAVFLEGFDQSAELAECDPMKSVYGAFKRRIGLSGQGHGRHSIAQPPGIFGKEQGETAVARDQPDPFILGMP